MIDVADMQLLSPGDVARVLSISLSAARRLIRARLPTVTVGERTIRVRARVLR